MLFFSNGFLNSENHFSVCQKNGNLSLKNCFYNMQDCIRLKNVKFYSLAYIKIHINSYFDKNITFVQSPQNVVLTFI